MKFLGTSLLITRRVLTKWSLKKQEGACFATNKIFGFMYTWGINVLAQVSVGSPQDLLALEPFTRP